VSGAAVARGRLNYSRFAARTARRLVNLDVGGGGSGSIGVARRRGRAVLTCFDLILADRGVA
jgi:hypothetical protein